MLATMTTTPTPTASSLRPARTRRHRVAATAATLTAVGLMLAATACSSGDASTAAPPTVAASAAPPTISEPVRSTASKPPPPTTAAPSRPDPARQAQLGHILAAHHDAGEFVGARIAIRDADGTVTEVADGTMTPDPSSGPVDPEVPWNIGSATKTFVAVVVLQLAAEGRIDLDAGIDRYLPHLAGANRITPRELLNHTSGLHEYNDQPAVVDHPLRHWTPSELIAVAEAAGRVGEPGGAHHYANTNYIVLGEIIEQVTGHTWSDEVHTRIAQPLGMTHTSVITHASVPGFAMVGGSLVDVSRNFDASVGGAAGALQSTSRDLLAFATALAHGTLLSPESRGAMQTFVPAEDYSQYGIDHGYGLGLERYAMKGMTMIGHMGTGETGSSYFGYDTERGTAIAVTTNTAIAGPAALMAVEALSPAS
jgi:D-alanyl-D-alanine carboxypeptidase